MEPSMFPTVYLRWTYYTPTTYPLYIPYMYLLRTCVPTMDLPCTVPGHEGDPGQRQHEQPDGHEATEPLTPGTG